MNINKEIIINLTPDDVKEIITEYCKREGYKANRIHFKVNTHLEGYGMGEYEVTEFEGCTVTCKGE